MRITPRIATLIPAAGKRIALECEVLGAKAASVRFPHGIACNVELQRVRTVLVT